MSIVVLPPKYSKIILACCYLNLIPISYGFYHKIFDLSFLSLLLSFTTFNYWRFPTKGIRRNIDITAVFLGLGYQLYKINWCPNSNFFFFIWFLAGLCYYGSWKIYSKNLFYSTLFHCNVHFLAHLALINLMFCLK